MLKHQSPGGFIEVFHSKCLNQRARHLGLRVGGLNFPSARRIRCTPIAHCVRLLITLYVCLMAVNDRAEKEREKLPTFCDSIDSIEANRDCRTPSSFERQLVYLLI